jgi:hypothetical protein
MTVMLRSVDPLVLQSYPETGRPLLVRLPNGTLGHFQRREDDCMRAAVAAILQRH